MSLLSLLRRNRLAPAEIAHQQRMDQHADTRRHHQQQMDNPDQLALIEDMRQASEATRLRLERRIADQERQINGMRKRADARIDTIAALRREIAVLRAKLAAPQPGGFGMAVYPRYRPLTAADRQEIADDTRIARAEW